MKIAVIGSGAAGMLAAWGLSTKHDVTLYEKDSDLGGHVNTLTTDCFENNLTFDNGFAVFNYETYPIFAGLVKMLGLEASRAKMSISISGGNTFTICEDVKQIFLANKLWMLDPRVPWLLANIIRFHAVARRDLAKDQIPDVTIREYLKLRRFSERLYGNYLGPVAGAVWICPPDEIAKVPARSFIKFFHHHNMLGFRKFKWFAIKGGSAQYIDALGAKLTRPALVNCAATSVRRNEEDITVTDARGNHADYDQIVMACHADTALELLQNPSDKETKYLGAFKFVKNRSICHRDPALMPDRPGLWSSWNCHFVTDEKTGAQHMAMSYFLNRLHKTDRTNPVFLSVSPHLEPDPELVIREYDWSHTLYDTNAINAQKNFAKIQGVNRIWYAGAWRGYGFHEDALGSGLTVARDLGCEIPDLPTWSPPDW